MNLPTLALFSAGLAVVATTCRSAPGHQMAIRPLFGPVAGNEGIIGKADDHAGHVWLLAGNALVRVDLKNRTQTRTPLEIVPAGQCWGLARLADGSLWTLRGRHAVDQIGEGGEVLREIPLQSPHLGLFAVGDRLLFQEADISPPNPAFFAARPGNADRVVWGEMKTRTFDGFSLGVVAALNLVSCGVSWQPEIPCWFPDEPVVSLVDPSGRTRRLELAGLGRIAPEKLVASSAPARPVRDVYLAADGLLWVLGSGTPPAKPSNLPGKPSSLPGGWVLARYRLDGTPIDRHSFREPVRLILWAGGGRALVLLGNGMVSEVIP
jgi:hypothetical protein